MFFPVRFRTHIQLSPLELSSNFDDVIKTKMKENLEGLCSRFGYIKPGSLQIIKRSAGLFGKQHFNGYIRFDLLCKGEACNPPQGLVVEAIVKNKNALGLLAESSMFINGEKIPVLDIIVPKKSNGIASEIDLDEVQTGDSIYIMVMGKRYQLNDTNISIIGRAVKQPNTNIRNSQNVDEDGVDQGDQPEGQNVIDDNVLENEDAIEYDDEEEPYSDEEDEKEDDEEFEDLNEEEFEDMDNESFGGFSDGEY
jgi:DNA-directed RNA polymerase subunit E'/Rpb7